MTIHDMTPTGWAIYGGLVFYFWTLIIAILSIEENLKLHEIHPLGFAITLLASILWPLLLPILMSVLIFVGTLRLQIHLVKSFQEAFLSDCKRK